MLQFFRSKRRRLIADWLAMHIYKGSEQKRVQNVDFLLFIRDIIAPNNTWFPDKPRRKPCIKADVGVCVTAVVSMSSGIS